MLNNILYTNEVLCKIGYLIKANCTFCKSETPETLCHIMFDCPFSQSFWDDVINNILGKLNSCRCLSLRDVIIVFLGGEMDLVNYVLLIGKSYI